MSTISKVLVVLVLLLVPIWIILIATVAQYNRNGSEAMEQLKKEVVQVEKDSAEAVASVQAMRDQIGLEQMRTGQDLATIRSKKAAIESMRTEALEIESRLKILQETSEASEKLVQTDREQRIAELKAEQAAMAAQEEEVEKLKEEHAKLSDRLAQLREEFKTTYESNKAKVARLVK